MLHQEKNTLTWHNYSDHLRDTLKEMITSHEFADVTLGMKLVQMFSFKHQYFQANQPKRRRGPKGTTRPKVVSDRGFKVEMSRL